MKTHPSARLTEVVAGVDTSHRWVGTHRPSSMLRPNVFMMMPVHDSGFWMPQVRPELRNGARERSFMPPSSSGTHRALMLLNRCKGIQKT
jgi:hypothetical protein